MEKKSNGTTKIPYNFSAGQKYDFPEIAVFL
jgi:hypothetical protein